jgi:hypothetical protein
MIKIKISDLVKERCIRFSNEVLETNIECYARRNQRNPEKIKQQIFEGKLAECAVYKYIKSLNIPVTKPDFIIRTTGKSYAADLFCKNAKGIHVKSQSRSLNSNGRSWVFQKNDTISTGLIAFCSVDLSNDEVIIDAIVEAKSIIKLYSDPIISTLVSKKCIYWFDLVMNKVKLWAVDKI